MKSQKGFSAVETILLVIIVGLIGFTGWYVYTSNGKANKTLDQANSVQNSTPTVKESNKTYESTAIKGLSFKYPTSWILENGETAFDGTDTTTLTSPQGSKVYWGSGGAGFGGNCDDRDYITILSVDATKYAKDLYVVYWKGTIYADTDKPIDYYHLAVHQTAPDGGAPKVGRYDGCIYPDVFPSRSGDRALQLAWKSDENSIKQPPKELDSLKQILASLSY